MAKLAAGLGIEGDANHQGKVSGRNMSTRAISKYKKMFVEYYFHSVSVIQMSAGLDEF